MVFSKGVLQFLVIVTQYFQRNHWVLLPFWIFRSFLYQFILFIEWLPLNIKKLLNRAIHGPMYKWSQRCVWWWLGVWIWCQGICSHHIYGVTFSSFHIVTQKIYNSVHPCEKVIGMFFHNQIWSRLLDMNRLCLVCIKRSIDEVTKCQISKLGYHQRRSDEILKEARCQFGDVKFGHRVMEAVVFFDHGMHNFIQITLNVTNRWSKGVISWFSDIILHE